MSNTVQQTILSAWQRQPKVRSSPSGWLSANAVCCHHNGHRADRRGRGGLIAGTDGGISYSCFNCGFRAHYKAGRALTYRMRKLLSWLGFDENQIRILVLEAIRVKDVTTDENITDSRIELDFTTKQLPEGSQSFAALAEFYALKGIDHCPKEFLDAVSYVNDRGIDMSSYEFYWSNIQTHSLKYRVIIPFEHKKRLIGYTARTFANWVKPKYYMETQPGYVFNIDRQEHDWQTVIVCEGVFDALSIDAVAVMHNEVNELQADNIDNLKRSVIVVPDWDSSGKKLLEQALEYQWAVSFPVWRETCKDINEAVQRYGKLFVLKTILDSAEHSGLKIQLWSKKTRWHNA